MKKELLVTGAGREATITVDRAADGTWLVTVDGAPRTVDARQIRPGTWSLMVDGQSYLVDLDPRKKGVPRNSTGAAPADANASAGVLAASVAASTVPAEAVLTVEDAQTRRLRESLSHGAPVRGEEVRAPIAGKVVKILCAVGDEIAAHQPVAVLEAMKMENEIVAERGGKVTEIKKDAGQSVETGELLMVLT